MTKPDKETREREERVAQARMTLNDALAPLTEMQRAFVEHFVHLGNVAQAYREAGYKPHRNAYALFRDPKIARAIAAAVKARDAENELGYEALCQLVAAAIRVQPHDVLVFADDGVTPIGLKDRAAMTPAEALRIVSMEMKTHASAKGHRGSTRRIEIQLADPNRLIDRLARLRGYERKKVEITGAGGGPVRSHITGGAPTEAESAAARDYYAALAGEIEE